MKTNKRCKYGHKYIKNQRNYSVIAERFLFSGLGIWFVAVIINIAVK